MLYLSNNIIATSDVHTIQKQYNVKAGSFHFSDYDRDILVFHKRQLKNISLKNLGQKMTIFYVPQQELEGAIHSKIPQKKKDCYHVASFNSAFTLFSSFDEINGEKNHFLYRINQQKTANLQTSLQALQSNVILNNNNDITRATTPTSAQSQEDLNDTYHITSFLFGLSLIYGNYQAKHDELLSIKIHIPIFWVYGQLAQTIKQMILALKHDGILVDHTMQDSNDGEVMQITINDYEIIEQLAHWYKPIASFSKITKKERADFFKSRIISYLEINNYDQATINLLQESMIKPLVVQ